MSNENTSQVVLKYSKEESTNTLFDQPSRIYNGSFTDKDGVGHTIKVQKTDGANTARIISIDGQDVANKPGVRQPPIAQSDEQIGGILGLGTRQNPETPVSIDSRELQKTIDSLPPSVRQGPPPIVTAEPDNAPDPQKSSRAFLQDEMKRLGVDSAKVAQLQEEWNSAKEFLGAARGGRGESTDEESRKLINRERKEAGRPPRFDAEGNDVEMSRALGNAPDPNTRQGPGGPPGPAKSETLSATANAVIVADTVTTERKQVEGGTMTVEKHEVKVTGGRLRLQGERSADGETKWKAVGVEEGSIVKVIPGSGIEEGTYRVGKGGVMETMNPSDVPEAYQKPMRQMENVLRSAQKEASVGAPTGRSSSDVDIARLGTVTPGTNGMPAAGPSQGRV